MRSIPQALMWEMFSHGRWWIPGFYVLGNLVPMLLFALFTHLGVDPHDHSFLVLHICFMPLLMMSFGGGILPAQGALSRLYTAPISTASLVAWHMFPGGILLAIEVAVAALTYNILFNLGWPIWGSAFFAVAAWASMQLLVSVSHRTLSSFCVACAPSVVLFGWLHSRYGSWFGAPTHQWSEVTPGEIGTMSVVVGIAYMVTVAAVTRDRCGEPMPSLGGWKLLVRTWDALTTTSGIGFQPFRSAAQAQLWYDWTLKGLALPLIVALIYVVMVSVWLIRIATGHNTGHPLVEFHEGILAGGGLLTLMAGVAGILMGISSNGNMTRNRSETVRDLAGSNSQEGMGNFQCTLPFTNHDFAKSVLQTGAKSVLISWGLWAAGVFGCLLIAKLMPHVPVQVFPPEIGVWYLPLTLLGPWIAMANLSTIGLSGRSARIVFIGTTGLILYCIGMILIKEVFSAEVQKRVFEISMYFASITTVGATLLVFTKAQRHSYLSQKSLCIAAVIWLGMATDAIAIRRADLPVMAYPMILAFFALVIMPLATTPLAIAWNRHR
ncbi:MAG: hypothetical protein WKF77_21295 [Planctomycetaceae bacterium]